MKKSYLLASSIATVALGFAATPTLAQQRTGGVFIDYVAAQLAISDIDGFDNGMALVVQGGKELRSIPGFAIEGEVTTTLSKPEAQQTVGSDIEASYWTLGGYGVYNLPVSQQVGLRGKLGAIYENVNVDGGEDKDEVNVGLGFGATFRLSQSMNVIAEYTRIEEDINHISAGVQFRF